MRNSSQTPLCKGEKCVMRNSSPPPLCKGRWIAEGKTEGLQDGGVARRRGCKTEGLQESKPIAAAGDFKRIRQKYGKCSCKEKQINL